LVKVQPEPGQTSWEAYRLACHKEWADQRAAERRWIVEEAVEAYEEGKSLRQVADHLNTGFPDGQSISYPGVRLMLRREGVQIRSRDTAPSSTALTLVIGQAQVRFARVHPEDVRVKMAAEYDRLLRVVERASEELVPDDIRRMVRVLMWLKSGAEQEQADMGRPLPGFSTLVAQRDGKALHHGPWKPITVAELADRAGISDEGVLQRNLSQNVEPVWPVWDRVLEVLGWHVEMVTDRAAAPGFGQRLPSDPFTLGQVLEQHRMDPHQLTQAAVAKAAGIARGTYIALEAGKRPTKYATVAAALARCGVTCRIAPTLSPELRDRLDEYLAEQEREAEYFASLQRYPRVAR
jgi:DNA-binding XRE family transcriptional regulator